MEWCINCHRNPSQFVRPRDQITTMGYTPSEDEPQTVMGPRLVKEYKIAGPEHMTSCSVCHR
jgi:hypothetical protein